MNIGIVTTWFDRGAAFVSRQFRDILLSEHEVFIYARGGERYGKGDPNWDGSYVTWGRRLPITVAMGIDRKDFERWLKQHSIDLVFFNEQHWWVPVLWCSELGITTGAYVDYYTRETVPLFDSYDFLVCNTRRHFSVFDWHQQAHYVPWGVDTSVFHPSVRTEREKGAVTFFHSAGMNPFRKGCDRVLSAFRNLNGNARLVVHTQKRLDWSIPDFVPMISELLSTGKLQVIERTVGPPGLYHLGDVYVYPTRLEGIGLTVPEALACGLPAIVPDNGPMNEFVTPETGKLVPVASCEPRHDGYYWPLCSVDEESLAEAMQFYVDHADELPELGRRAREHAAKELNWSDRADAILKVFREVRRRPNKSEAMEQTREFELRRCGLRNSFVISLPGLSRTIQRIYDLLPYHLL